MSNQDVQQQSGQPQRDIPWFLKAKCPVFLPKSDALTLHTDEFEAFVRDSLRTVPENTTQTASNYSAAFDSTKSKTPLLDLFYHHDEVDSNSCLREPLAEAWAEDPDSTLKIIFHARSIHLGKSSRLLFYRCAGWLATNHPLTLLANLRWLVRPVIPKKAKETTDEDAVVVEAAAALSKLEVLDANLSEGAGMADELVLDAEHDVKNGVAHGYWKDLLNILVLSANGRLDVATPLLDILYVEREMARMETWSNKEDSREIRHVKRHIRHETVVDLYTNNPLHRAIHLTVARLFAAQLQSDLAALAGDDKTAKGNISLCGKWAPSTDRFHDRHTFVVSSIAEIMFPKSQLVEKGILPPSTNDDQRTTYLRHARDSYRKAVAALRKHLEVVERDLSAHTLENINYDRVPSIAMDRYAKTFDMKDPMGFEAFAGRVASGLSRIRAATLLLPGTMINKLMQQTRTESKKRARRKGRIREMVESLLPAMEAQVLDGQWNTLVQRIKDSGTMLSCIAVCDISESMCWPTFRDGTCPLDSAIGLSLLIAEVAQPPFRGAFIPFGDRPAMKIIDVSATLMTKVKAMYDSSLGPNTDFEAVFTALILPMAIENKLKPEEMVKRIFVFSHMQFDQARQQEDTWSTSYERIQKAYQEAGYEVPELAFWNLAGGEGATAGTNTWDVDAPIDPEPLTVDHTGVTMVSGYSQSMLKVLLDGGPFQEEEAEVVETVVEDEDEDELVEGAVKKFKLDPLDTVMKAISPKAFAMLKVVD